MSALFNTRIHFGRHVDVSLIQRAGSGGRLTVPVECDDVHFAAVRIIERTKVNHCLLERFLNRHAKAHEGDDAVRGAATLRHLATTRAGRRTPTIVCVIAGADDRRITEASRIFPGPTRCADTAGYRALIVASNEVDRAVQIFDLLRIAHGRADNIGDPGVIGFPRARLSGAEVAESLFPDGSRFGRQEVDGRQPDFACETVRTRAHDQHVG